MTPQSSVNTQGPRSDDRALWDVAFAVYGYPALLIAHRLKVFSLLGEGARTLSDICETLNIQRRPAEAILTAATALGFLSLQDGSYSLTARSEDYLLEKSPSYFGFFWDMMIDNSQVFSYASLEQAVLTNSPQAYGGGDIYEIAAAYAYHLAESQAWFDGNKRTGVQASLVFLEGCGIDTSGLPEQQTHDLMIKIAAHEADRGDLADYLRSELGREERLIGGVC